MKFIICLSLSTILSTLCWAVPPSKETRSIVDAILNSPEAVKILEQKGITWLTDVEISESGDTSKYTLNFMSTGMLHQTKKLEISVDSSQVQLDGPAVYTSKFLD